MSRSRTHRQALFKQHWAWLEATLAATVADRSTDRIRNEQREQRSAGDAVVGLVLVADAARRLGVTVDDVLKRIDAGELPSFLTPDGLVIPATHLMEDR